MGSQKETPSGCFSTLNSLKREKNSTQFHLDRFYATQKQWQRNEFSVNGFYRAQSILEI